MIDFTAARPICGGIQQGKGGFGDGIRGFGADCRLEFGAKRPMLLIETVATFPPRMMGWIVAIVL
jgi:hypothetical protein